MANFRVDTDGNLWIGTNISENFATAKTEAKTKFYVEKDGTIKSTAGTIGGIVIDADGLESDNYDESTKTGWRLDNANGIGNYFDINIVLPSSLSETPSTGTTTLDFGNSKIFDFNNDLFLEANDDVIVKSVLRLGYASDGLSEPRLLFGNSASTSGSSINPVMGIESTLVNATDYGGSSSNLARELNFSNGSSTPVMIMNSVNDTVEFTGDIKLATNSDIYIGTDRGSNGDVLTKENGNIVWASSSGNDHPDSDHDFLDQTDGDARYVRLINQSAHQHTSYDDYDHWDAKATTGGSTTNMQMNSGFGLEFAAGTGISFGVQTSPSYKITINNTSTGGSGFTSVNRTVSTYSDGVFMKRNVGLAAAGTTLNYYLSTRGDDLTIDDARPSSNKASNFGISTNEYDVIHAETGQFTFVYGANFGGSSQYFKKDVSDISLGLDFINALEPKTYKYKEQVYGADDKLGFGLIAEDIITVLDTFNVSNTRLLKEGRTDYKYYGQCSHELICTCEDLECCPDPMLSYDRETEEWTQEGGCYKNAKCTMPCCTDIAGTTVDGVNFVHASEEECELEFIDVRKHPSLKYDELIAPLIKAVQELSTQISDLTARVEALEG